MQLLKILIRLYPIQLLFILLEVEALSLRTSPTVVPRDFPSVTYNANTKACDTDYTSQACLTFIQTTLPIMLKDQQAIYDAVHLTLLPASSANTVARAEAIVDSLKSITTGLSQLQSVNVPDANAALKTMSATPTSALALLTSAQKASLNLPFTAQWAQNIKGFQDSLRLFITQQANLQQGDLSAAYNAFISGMSKLQESLASAMAPLDTQLTALEANLTDLPKTATSLKSSITSQIAALVSLQATLERQGEAAVYSHYNALRASANASMTHATAADLASLQSAIRGVTASQNTAAAAAVTSVKSQIAKSNAADASYAASIASVFSALYKISSDYQNRLASNVSYFNGNLSLMAGTLMLTENTTQATQNKSVKSLAKSITSYANLTSGNRGRAKSKTRALLDAVDAMLNVVVVSASKHASQLTGGSGAALSTQAYSLSNATKSFNAKLNATAVAAQRAAATQKETLSATNLKVLATMADLLLQLNTLSEFARGKMGSSSDSANAALEMLNSFVSGGADDLADTVAMIGSQGTANHLANQQALLRASIDKNLDAQDAVTENDKAQAAAQDDMQKVTDRVTLLADKKTNETSKNVAKVTDAIDKVQDTVALNTMAKGQGNLLVDRNWAELFSDARVLESGALIALNGVSNKTNDYIEDQALNAFEAMNSSASALNSTMGQAFKQLNTYRTDSIAALSVLSSLVVNAANASFGLAKSTSDTVDAIINKTSADGKAASAVINTLTKNLTDKLNNRIATLETNFLANLTSVRLDLLNQTSLKYTSAYNAALKLLSETENRTAGLVRNSTTAAINATLLSNQMTQIVKDYGLAKNYSQGAQNASLAWTVGNVSQGAANLTKMMQTLGAGLSIALTQAALQISKINASLPATIQKTVQSATKNVTLTDSAALAQFITKLTGSFEADRQGKRSWLLSQSDSRLQTIDGLLGNVRYLGGSQGAEVILQGSKDSASQATANDALSMVSRALGILAAQGGTYASEMSGKIQSVADLASGLDASLSGYISSAGSRMQNQLKMAGQQYSARANVQMAGQASAVYGLGNQVLALLKGASSQQLAAEGLNAANQQGAMQVADLVKSFGAKARSELEMLLTKVTSGQMTMQQAIKSASQVNLESLSTLGDVAEALLLIIQSYQSQLDQYMSDADDVLSTFSDSLNKTVSNYQVIHLAAAAPLATLAKQALAAESFYENYTTSVIQASNKTMVELQARRDNDTSRVSEFTQRIALILANATDQLGVIQANSSSAVLAIAKGAKAAIVSRIMGFRQAHKLRALPANEVAIEGVAITL